ncbi:hypothetical protein LEP1GSC058_4116 [Leptospira fainei serovar Hurstbridge str. BUT 6]|uniref:Uncharacterized protein n=1 Tax=Leptospira fainei serovar Hurstbridge str. BUT 6 TaxID=1193011 RepID=S3UUN4_9LEPT|nr:hypothetical protein LEP1GSC058_4116 [Leptospira fainei serovar Hurstbridge str. BUT 6]
MVPRVPGRLDRVSITDSENLQAFFGTANSVGAPTFANRYLSLIRDF